MKNPKVKKFLVVICILVVIVDLIAAVVFLSLEKYYDKNTWARISISENGDVENTIVREYAKGDTMDVSFAEVNVLKVRKAGNGYIIFKSDADIIYNGEVFHKVKFYEDNSFQIKSGDNIADLRIYDIFGN